MKKIIALIVCLFALSNTFAGNPVSRGSVVLTPNNYRVHYMLGGTTRCSGESSIIYQAAQQGWGLQSVGDPYTFKSELYFSFAFYKEGGGRGKILNVSDLEYTVEYTCYDMDGRAVYTESVVIVPRTFSRIMVRGDAYHKHLSKIVCKIK